MFFNVTWSYPSSEATQAENDLDKDMLEVKALETKIGDLSKLTFKQTIFFLT